MTRVWWRCVVSVLLVSGSPAAAHASEVDLLLDKLVAREILTSADASEIRDDMKHEQEASTASLAKDTLPDSSRHWKWSGDIRLREEYRNRSGDGTDTNRQRIRFRYGVDAKVSDQLKVGARMATGSITDPISTNQSFSTSFNHKTLVLDRAFAEYAPEIPGLSKTVVTGGIIPNPFWVVGPLVWDDDLNFDGAAVKLSEDLGPRVTLFTNDGVFSLNTDVIQSSALWSLQGGVVLKPFADAHEELLKSLKVTSALAYHDYMNVTSKASNSTALTNAGGTKGNSTNLKDLNLINPTFEVASQYHDVPFGLFADMVHNTAAATLNDGFQIGLKIGKARVPFDPLKGWEAGYFFERIEPDATLGAFTDSDFGNGGTNHRGHVYWLKLATIKNSTLQLKYFNTQEIKGPTKNHADTFQADWVTTF